MTPLVMAMTSGVHTRTGAASTTNSSELGWSGAALAAWRSIERRWGPKIQARRGIYRDPVRSGRRGHFVPRGAWRRAPAATDRPCRWPAAGAGSRSRCSPRRSLGLAALAPSERFAHEQARRRKKLTTDRPGAPAPPAARPLAARAAAERGGRQQLRRHRAARGRRPSPHPDHPAPARCPARLFDPPPPRRCCSACSRW